MSLTQTDNARVFCDVERSGKFESLAKLFGCVVVVDHISVSCFVKKRLIFCNDLLCVKLLQNLAEYSVTFKYSKYYFYIYLAII